MFGMTEQDQWMSDLVDWLADTIAWWWDPDEPEDMEPLEKDWYLI